MDDKLKSDLDQIGLDLVNAYKDAITNVNAVSSGRLRDSIGYEIVFNDDYPNIIITAEDYWEFSNYGRKPGEEPPIDNLQQWISNKGLRLNPYQLANIIGEKGTKGKGWYETVDLKPYLDRIKVAYSKYLKRSFVAVFNRNKR